MKILFCDFIFQKGNAHVDTEIIKSFLRKNDVTVMANSDRYSDKLPGAHFVENKHYVREKGTIKIYLGILRNMILAAKYANKYRPDCIFVSVYETRSFALGRLFFKDKNKIVILENANIDLLKKKSYRFFYNLYCNKVRHVVYESYMKDFLCKDICIKNELINVMPHPCYECIGLNTKKKEFDCIAISGSNDENQIREFVSYEKEHQVLRQNNIRVLIKSKETKYDNGFLVVTDEYFSNEDYESYFENCKVVYTPFSDTYKYRMSGCFVDSFSHRKPVVSNTIMLATYYEKKFPGIIYTSCSPERIIKLMIQLCNQKIDSSMYDAFLEQHSRKYIDLSVDSILNQE